MTTAPPVSPEEKRARWSRETCKIAVAVEDHALPVPRIDENKAIFGIYGQDADVQCQFEAAEAGLGEVFGVTFAARTDKLGTSDTDWYILEAALPSGMVLRIETLARQVAEKKVTGRTFTEVTEWVRKPAAVPAGSGAAA